MLIYIYLIKRAQTRANLLKRRQENNNQKKKEKGPNQEQNKEMNKERKKDKLLIHNETIQRVIFHELAR